MNGLDHQTAAQMDQVYNALLVLIIAVIGMGTAFFLVMGATFKWYIPRRFELQTEEREARLDKFKGELTSQREADAADVERERVLPRLVEAVGSFAANNNQMAQNFLTMMQSRIEQDAQATREISAHTLSVNGVSKSLDELRGQFVDVRKQIEAVVTQSAASESTSKRTLEAVETFSAKLDTVAQAAKRETKPIPVVIDGAVVNED